MKLEYRDLVALAALAIDGAVRAGEMISSCAGKPVEISHKGGNSTASGSAAGTSLAAQVVTEVDARSQEILLDVLRPTLSAYDLGLLTEESEDDNSRFEKDFFWSIDPLDGTLRFIEGKGGYSVAVALVDRCGEPHLGIVFDPVEKTIYHAVRGGGAFRNHTPFNLPSGDDDAPLSLIHDRTFGKQKDYPAIVDAVETISKSIGYPGFRAYEFGGSVMNACRVLEENPAVYFKFPQTTPGGGCLWDFAATTCIYNEIGAFATDISGSSLPLNNRRTWYLNREGVLFTGVKAVQERVSRLYLDLQAEKSP